MYIQKNIPLAPFTTYKIGGPADLFTHAYTREELKNAIDYALQRGIPYFILGLGANILVSDQGFRGLVIRNSYRLLEWDDALASGQDYRFLRAGSGATVEEVIHFAQRHGYSGLEHYAGIPSTIGGALWQNLHFLNPDRDCTVFIAEVVHHAHVLHVTTPKKQPLQCEEKVFLCEDFRFGYDQSILHQGKHIVLDVVFQLRAERPSTIAGRIRENLKWRNERHPPFTSEFSCGSVFKKVFKEGAELGAGRLIEKAGLKGYTHQGAMVSLRHANFITHTGAATASDIVHIIRHVKRVVFERTGAVLELEIRLVGEF